MQIVGISPADSKAQPTQPQKDCFRSHKRKAYRLSKKENRTQMFECDKTFCSMCLKNFYDIDFPQTLPV